MDKVNILLVDDQPGKLLSCQTILAGLNQNLVLARSGAEALQCLLQEEFALVLLDVIMPGMDGFETAAMIRQRPRLEQTPIIFLTSHSASDLDRLKGYGLGAVDFVFTPVIPAILLGKVSVFVELYRKRKELAQANERLRAEINERERAQDKALAAERLAAIGQLITGLAHESRNSLQQIQAATAMLTRRLPPGPESALVLEISKAHDRLHGLFEAVRGYAEPLQLDREERDVADLWRAAWDQLAPVRGNRTVHFHEDVSGAAWRCLVAPLAIERLFRNLFENALGAAGDPAVIEVGCSEALCDGRPAVRVRVGDNGSGLTSAQRQRLFDPFYTTKTRGAGLGLAVARRIVEAHGGQIEACAGPGAGTTLEMLLPKGLS